MDWSSVATANEKWLCCYPTVDALWRGLHILWLGAWYFILGREINTLNLFQLFFSLCLTNTSLNFSLTRHTFLTHLICILSSIFKLILFCLNHSILCFKLSLSHHRVLFCLRNVVKVFLVNFIGLTRCYWFH